MDFEENDEKFEDDDYDAEYYKEILNEDDEIDEIIDEQQDFLNE